MPRPGGFQPMKRTQRKLAPGPQTQAMTRGRAVGQGKVLAQALKNGVQAKDKRQSVGPVAKVALPPKPRSGALKQLLAMKDEQMQRKRKPRKMRERKSLIPPQSRL